MSTSHATVSRTHFDRFVDYMLDVDGDMYGQDERERTRWYEGIALAASVQWVLVPWLMAILVWTVSADTARVLGWVGLTFLMPMSLATIYVERRRVDTAVRRWTAKRIVWSAVSTVPIFVFLVGFARAVDSGLAWAMLLGGVLGGIAGVLASTVRRRKRFAADDDE